MIILSSYKFVKVNWNWGMPCMKLLQKWRCPCWLRFNRSTCWSFWKITSTSHIDKSYTIHAHVWKFKQVNSCNLIFFFHARDLDRVHEFNSRIQLSAFQFSNCLIKKDFWPPIFFFFENHMPVCLSYMWNLKKFW